MQPNLLMIEDDAELAVILCNFLKRYNIMVTNYEDPYLGISALSLTKYDLLILDLSLPGMDGLEICKEVRSKSDIPIIISSARSDLEDKIVGLELGADDYLPKPYDPKEMYARIQSLIRRYKKSSTLEEQQGHSVFAVDEKRHEISFKAEVLNLTPAEYEILSYMIRQNGFSISREQLVYNCKSLKDKGSKSLDVIIGRLRSKIGDDSKSPEYIHSVRGIGYKLVG